MGDLLAKANPTAARLLALFLAGALLWAGLAHAFEECCRPAGGPPGQGAAAVGPECCDHVEDGDAAASGLLSQRRTSPESPSAWTDFPSAALFPAAAAEASSIPHPPPLLPAERPRHLVLGCFLC